MIDRSIFTTKDGSKTLYWPKYDEHYHSVHGAKTESLHVFIKHGLEEVAKNINEISILEIGFGTGLNTILTYQKASDLNLSINYVSLDPYPIELGEVKSLELDKMLQVPLESILLFHTISWGEYSEIHSKDFLLLKAKTTVEDFETDQKFDLIYFDAFAPSAQPELWTMPIFEKLYHLLNKNGILTTYCAKGQVKRDLKAVGFLVEPLPGPPGKREMTRARK